MFNIAVAQSGGPTSAINASLAGVFRQASKSPEIGKIYGSINGIEGMIKGDLVPLDQRQPHRVRVYENNQHIRGI